MLKQLGGIASMLKNAQQMGAKMKEVQESLRHERVVGIAGAEMVRVEANGLGEVLSVRIDKEVFSQGDREMIEDLIPSAVNDALARAKQLNVEKMQDAAGGLELPGLEDAVKQFMGDMKPE